MNRTFSRIVGLTCALLAATVTPLLAHDLWLMPEDTVPGKPYTLRAVFGHNFPAGSVLPGAQYTKMSVIAPGGEKTPVTFSPSGINQMVRFTPKMAGQHVVIADYVSYYAHGAPREKMLFSKDKLQGEKYAYAKHVFQCAKAVVGTGDSAAATRPTGQAIEIVPQQDTAALKVGDLLPVRVLWKGKPIEPAPGEEVDVKAVWAGFQEDEDTFAFLGHADKNGVCRIKITHPGWWLVMIEHDAPAQDPAKEDREGYVATLVFHVAPGK